MSVTIATQIQVDVVLAEAMRAFKRRVLPITLFAHAIRNVQLKGTDKVSVPYYPLVTTVSADWAAGTGYTSGDGTISYKQITVNKRKFQPLRFTSSEANRQPELDPEKLGMMMGEKLAEDVVSDILSVVTQANFGDSVFQGPANAFNSDDVSDLRTLCNQAFWPKGPSFRGLILDSAYDGNLVKDLKNYSASGSNQIWRDGELQEVLGFRYAESPLIPANAENLIGMAVNPSAILVAFSPIQPTAAVMAVTNDYRQFTDPDTNLTLEYREIGEALFDRETRVIECNYGYAVGETAACKRLVGP